jgi:peptide/nickel transport system substrate-binding protein
LSVVSVAACAPAAGPAGGSGAAAGENAAPRAPQRTLNIALRGEPPTLATKPLVAFTNALRPPLNLFNAELDFTDEREVPFAYLAQAIPQINTDTWRIMPDGRMETTYQLKPNLTWQDGTALSAEDFVFAWRVYATPQLGVSGSPPIGMMEEIVAPDPNTVVIRWKQPYADAASMRDDFQALPRHILQDNFQTMDPVAFSGLPFWGPEYVGLGPYKLDHWEPGASIEASAFDGHVLGRPKIDRLRLMFISDPNTALANLLAGEVQYVGEFVFADDHAATLEREWSGNQGGTVLYAPTALRTSVFQLRPEYADPAGMLDVRVRQALAHGVDPQLANDVLNSGKGIVSSTLTSPRVDFYPEIERVITKYSYDVRQAQQLMEEAGFVRGTDGFFVGANGTPFKLGVWSSSGAKNEQENAVIVDTLRKSGFDASRSVFSAAQLADAQARALIPGLSTRGQATKPLENYISSQIPRAENRWTGEDRGGWSNADFDRAYDAFSRALDVNERHRKTAELERIFTANLPAIPHWYNPSVTASVASLKGPVARQTPDSPTAILHIHEWEWIS